ncbi:MAG: MgtC/SapB family protein [Vicingaceae bacterium]
MIIDLGPISLLGCFTSVLCGGLIGLERQLSGKPAGIRTSILICLSAYTFVAIGKFYPTDEGMLRVVGQIVTGVGFLGAGVIISRNGLIKGVTSAAVIWILAAIGCLIGLDNYLAALVTSLITLIVLVGINMLEKSFFHLKKGVHEEQSSKDKPYDD